MCRVRCRLILYFCFQIYFSPLKYVLTAMKQFRGVILNRIFNTSISSKILNSIYCLHQDFVQSNLKKKTTFCINCFYLMIVTISITFPCFEFIQIYMTKWYINYMTKWCINYMTKWCINYMLNGVKIA